LQASPSPRTRVQLGGAQHLKGNPLLSFAVTECVVAVVCRWRRANSLRRTTSPTRSAKTLNPPTLIPPTQAITIPVFPSERGPICSLRKGTKRFVLPCFLGHPGADEQEFLFRLLHQAFIFRHCICDSRPIRQIGFGGFYLNSPTAAVFYSRADAPTADQRQGRRAWRTRV
jgi:hypothetical protein